jgi:hypothetical protein
VTDPVRDALLRARTAIDDALARVDTPGGPREPLPTPPRQDAPATPTGLRATPTPANLRLDVNPDPAATQWRWRDELDPVAPIKDLTTEPRTIRSAMKPTSRPRRYSVQAGDTAGRWSAWSAPLDVTPTPAQNGAVV